LSAHEQFELLFRSTHRHAVNLAYHIVGHRSDAEDVTQAAYLRAWQHFDEFKGDRPFETWLMKIITNCSIDLLRYRKRRAPTYSLDSPARADAEAETLDYEAPDPAADPEKIVLSSILDERLETALRALPAPWREAMLLSDVEQWTCQEIATKMHWNTATVRSRISRAHRRLRRLLDPDADRPARCKRFSTGPRRARAACSKVTSPARGANGPVEQSPADFAGVSRSDCS
jgi:RNA polymerase sigma-70 factor (ECF subfamily)